MSTIETLKTIFVMIPKKGISFILLLFISFIGDRAFSSYFSNEAFLELDKLTKSTLIAGGFVLVYFTIAFVYQSVKYANTITNNAPDEIKNIINPQKRKRKLTNRFELQTLSNEFIEIVVYVKRKWQPDDAQPNVEDFIRALDYTEPRCSQCHGDFVINYRRVKSFHCPSSACKNDQHIFEDDMFHAKQNVHAKFAGDVRRDFQHFWDIYIETYLQLTSGKPHEYEDTW